MGHRESKKERTAVAIEDAALRLFDKRGYDATTVADIAAAADISPRTFFGYFPSKESVLFGDFEPTFTSLAERLGARTGKETVIDALRAWIVDHIEHEGLPDKREVLRRRVIESNEPLLAYERQLLNRFEGLLTAAVATELGDAPDDVHPRLVGAVAAAALIALQPRSDGPAPDPGADPMEQLDDALAFLRGGMTALLRRRARPARAS